MADLSFEKAYPVMTPCVQYARQVNRWGICRETIEGEDVVKEQGEKYLPMASGKDNECRKARYEAFKMRTPYVNFIGGAHGVMHAMIFRRTPSVVVSENFKESKLLDNVDGKGNTLYQFVSDSVADLLKTGFGAWVLDAPAVSPSMSKNEAEKRGLRPHLSYYPAESIINWGYENTTGIRKLCFVVLKEIVGRPVDTFGVEYTEQYRVLILNERGKYEQRVYTPIYKKNEYTGEKTIERMDITVYPISVNINGKAQEIDYLPIKLLPSETPEKPPLFDLAMQNIHHYQLSADYTNGVHMTTVPTGYITGYTAKDNEEDNDIVLGGDAFLTDENSDAKFGVLSFSGEGLEHCEKAIDKCEAQIAGIFMKNIAPDKKTSETAEAAYVHRSGENARLATFARNISAELTQMIKWYAEWNGYDTTVEIHLNYDYETMSLDPNIINSIANISGQGKFPLYCVFYILQQQELINPDMNYDDFIFLVDQENLSGNSAMEIYEAFKLRLAERAKGLKPKVKTPKKGTPEFGNKNGEKPEDKDKNSDKNSEEKDDKKDKNSEE